MAGVSAMVLVGLASLGLGVLFHIVGMATPAWSTYGNHRETGPFKFCIRLGCGSVQNPPTEVEAVQAMTIIGVLCGGVALVIGILLFAMAIMGKGIHKTMSLVVVFGSILALIFIIIGAIIWAAKVHHKSKDLGYSFGLSIAGGVLVGLGGILVYIGAKKGTTASLVT